MTDEPTQNNDTREISGLIPGAAGLMVAGFLTTFLSPLLAVSFANDFGFGIENAGVFVTCGQAGVAVGAFGSLPVLPRLDRRLTGSISVVLVAACLAATGFAGSFGVLLALQIMLGIGAGVAYAAANSALAYARLPERAFSAVTISWMLVGAAMLALGPLLQDAWPKAGLYLGMAAAEVLCLVFIVRLPDVRRIPKGESQQAPLEADTQQGSAGVTQPRIGVAQLAPTLLVFALLLMNVANLMIWTFAQQIGEHAGLSAQATSTFLGLSQLVGLVGAGIAFTYGDRVGKLVLLVPSVLGLAAGNILVGTASNPAQFTIGFIVVNISFFCMTPLLLALAAELDSEAGRLVVIAGGASLVAGAIAPALGGLIAGHEEAWLRLGVAALCLGLLALPLLISPVRTAANRKPV